MRVTEKLTLKEYFDDPRFDGRAGNLLKYSRRTDMFALVSNHYFYFGNAAIPFAPQHLNHPRHPIEKRGQWHRYLPRCAEPIR